MRWVFLATARFLFPRLAGCRGYLGYVPYTDAMCWVQSEEREGTSSHGQDLLPPGLGKERGARLMSSAVGAFPNLPVPGYLSNNTVLVIGIAG